MAMVDEFDDEFDFDFRHMLIKKFLHKLHYEPDWMHGDFCLPNIFVTFSIALFHFHEEIFNCKVVNVDSLTCEVRDCDQHRRFRWECSFNGD